ncbi:MAG: hypothetical protein ACR2JG_14040 [Geodermatophilaceae bacterium]
MAAFDLVDRRGGSPVWVSLQAPSGWGKIRIVQEFFTQLSATRRGWPRAPERYWPSALVDSVAGGDKAHCKWLWRTFRGAVLRVLPLGLSCSG